MASKKVLIFTGLNLLTNTSIFSFHPVILDHTKRSIPYGLKLRLRRICYSHACYMYTTTTTTATQTQLALGLFSSQQ